MTTEIDLRPPVAVGHVRLHVRDIGVAARWLETVGLRPIVTRDELAVLELRGGTHVVVRQAEQPIAPGAAAPFDLMVDDIDAAHRTAPKKGCRRRRSSRGRIHDLCSISPARTVGPSPSTHRMPAASRCDSPAAAPGRVTARHHENCRNPVPKLARKNRTSGERQVGVLFSRTSLLMPGGFPVPAGSLPVRAGKFPVPAHGNFVLPPRNSFIGFANFGSSRACRSALTKKIPCQQGSCA